MALILEKEVAPFAKGDKVKISKKYRMLFDKNNEVYDGVLTVSEYKPKVRLPPFLVDILYLEETGDDPSQSQYFEKVK